MPGKVKPIPEGYHTVTPYLTLRNAARAIEFYKRAFGAKELNRMDGPQGKIGHAELKIGDSIIMLADEMPGTGNKAPESLNGTCGGLFLYVENVDSVYDQAIQAGAKADQRPADQFWGDRYGKLTDPFGYSWSVATHKEDVPADEMRRRAQEAMNRTQHQPVG